MNMLVCLCIKVDSIPFSKMSHHFIPTLVGLFSQDIALRYAAMK